jgi:DNA-binding FadR family transcriptional regulator
MQEKVTEKTKEQEIRKIKVSDIGTAKDYLADTFGISRTTLRSAKAILEQAALHNIEFDGLE